MPFSHMSYTLLISNPVFSTAFIPFITLGFTFMYSVTAPVVLFLSFPSRPSTDHIIYNKVCGPESLFFCLPSTSSADESSTPLVFPATVSLSQPIMAANLHAAWNWKISSTFGSRSFSKSKRIRGLCFGVWTSAPVSGLLKQGCGCCLCPRLDMPWLYFGFETAHRNHVIAICLFI